MLSHEKKKTVPIQKMTTLIDMPMWMGKSHMAPPPRPLQAELKS